METVSPTTALPKTRSWWAPSSDEQTQTTHNSTTTPEFVFNSNVETSPSQSEEPPKRKMIKAKRTLTGTKTLVDPLVQILSNNSSSEKHKDSDKNNKSEPPTIAPSVLPRQSFDQIPPMESSWKNLLNQEFDKGAFEDYANLIQLLSFVL
jgi:hypothetical protein